VRTVALIGAPSSMGAHAPGQERAPRALREAGLAERLRRAGREVTDRGDATLRRWAPDREHRRAQNAAAVAAAAREVSDRVEAALRAEELPLVLGGDCTTELGVVAGALRAGPERAGLVYLDMHPDLNTPETVPGGTLDWMGVAHLLALPGTVPELAGLGPRTPLLAPADVVLLGADPGQSRPEELSAIAAHRIQVVPLGQVAHDARAAARLALDHVAGAERLLVHFDVDVVDFVDQPLSENTGLNIGLPFAGALAALEVLCADPRLAALTVTEHNPLHGAEDGSTTAVLADGLVRAARAAA
jgi:arginase